MQYWHRAALSELNRVELRCESKTSLACRCTRLKHDKHRIGRGGVSSAQVLFHGAKTAAVPDMLAALRPDRARFIEIDCANFALFPKGPKYDSLAIPGVRTVSSGEADPHEVSLLTRNISLASLNPNVRTFHNPRNGSSIARVQKRGMGV